MCSSESADGCHGRPKPSPDEEDDSSASQDNAGVRAPLVRLVNDVVFLRCTEIDQLRRHQQSRNDYVCHYRKCFFTQMRPRAISDAYYTHKHDTDLFVRIIQKCFHRLIHKVPVSTDVDAVISTNSNFFLRVEVVVRQ